MSIQDGGPAFPCPKFIQSGDVAVAKPEGGMTLRDYFAGQIIVGIISMSGVKHDKPLTEIADQIAASSYCLADAMLSRRKPKEQEPPEPEIHLIQDNPMCERCGKEHTFNRYGKHCLKCISVLSD